MRRSPIIHRADDDAPAQVRGDGEECENEEEARGGRGRQRGVAFFKRAICPAW